MNHRVCALLAMLVAIVLGCGSKSSPQGPGGNGGQDVIIVDATSAAPWTGSVVYTRRENNGFGNCYLMTDTTTTSAAYLNAAGFIGGVRVEEVPSNPQCCNGARQESTIRSAARYDLSQYSSARVQCRVRTTLWNPTINNRQATFTVHSNVPGTRDLQLFDATPDGEQAIDVSLENVLTFHEASFELRLKTGSGCTGDPGHYYGGDIIIEVLDFKIVGTRR